MATWRYQDPSGSYDITDEQILAECYTWWQEQMRKAGKADLITPENCIEDFVVVHWAWKVDDRAQT